MKVNQLMGALLLLTMSCTSEELIPNNDDTTTPELTRMYLDRTLNEEILFDTDFEQTENGFSATVSRDVSRKSLVTSFEFQGNSISIDGVNQESGITANDFTKTLTYSVASNGQETKTYDIDIVRFTNLPIVDIRTTGNQPIDQKEDYVEAKISMSSDVHEEFNFSNLPAGIRGRGNSTWYFHDKKPYQLKFDDKTSMFGLPADKKWIFLAEHSDKSLLRNRLAFEMGRISELPYTPQGQMAEVFINSQYVGTYHICQKVEESSNRVDLKDDGWLMEIDQLDRIDEGDTYFSTNNFYINIKDPDTEFVSEEYTHVKGHINAFENALMGDNFKDEDLGYRQYVDMTTFADWFLINEIMRNPDARNWSSIYLTYVRGEKITMGPLWDFDLALGNSYYEDGLHENTSGFWVRDNAWISRMMEDPEFSSLVRERFNYFKTELPNLINFVNENAHDLRYANIENNKKWNVIGEWIWPNTAVYDTYDEEVEHVKNYLTERMEWLDNNL